MKEIIEKIGLDKIAHLGIGGLICAMLSNMLMLQDGVEWKSLLYVLFSIFVVFVISVFKEYFMDDKFCWADIIWAIAGCILYLMTVIIGIALYISSH